MESKMAKILNMLQDKQSKEDPWIVENDGIIPNIGGNFHGTTSLFFKLETKIKILLLEEK